MTTFADQRWLDKRSIWVVWLLLDYSNSDSFPVTLPCSWGQQMKVKFVCRIGPNWTVEIDFSPMETNIGTGFCIRYFWTLHIVSIKGDFYYGAAVTVRVIWSCRGKGGLLNGPDWIPIYSPSSFICSFGKWGKMSNSDEGAFIHPHWLWALGGVCSHFFTQALSQSQLMRVDYCDYNDLSFSLSCCLAELGTTYCNLIPSHFLKTV